MQNEFIQCRMNHEKCCSLNWKRMKKWHFETERMFQIANKLNAFAHQLWRFGVNWKTSLYLTNYIKMFEFHHNFSVDEWLQSLPNAIKMNRWLIITKKQNLSSSTSFICTQISHLFIWRFIEYYTPLNVDKFEHKIDSKHIQSQIDKSTL